MCNPPPPHTQSCLWHVALPRFFDGWQVNTSFGLKHGSWLLSDCNVTMCSLVLKCALTWQHLFWPNEQWMYFVCHGVFERNGVEHKMQGCGVFKLNDYHNTPQGMWGAHLHVQYGLSKEKNCDPTSYYNAHFWHLAVDCTDSTIHDVFVRRPYSSTQRQAEPSSWRLARKTSSSLDEEASSLMHSGGSTVDIMPTNGGKPAKECKHNSFEAQMFITQHP